MSNLTKSIPADERKMLKKAFWRSFTLYAAVSPAKQGASGFCYALMPFINKFYKNDEEGKKEALVRSMSYFNTTITCSTFIMGLVASMEKKNSEQKDFDANSINAVKSSLMGPLAGIGDSIFWCIRNVIASPDRRTKDTYAIVDVFNGYKEKMNEKGMSVFSLTNSQDVLENLGFQKADDTEASFIKNKVLKLNKDKKK